MSTRIKVLLAVLCVGALASVWRLGAYLTNRASQANFTVSSQLLEQFSRDTDGDGLPDFEETFWKTDFRNPDTDGDGFLDGEEILSGHDPAVPGPNDLLKSKRNLTELTALLLAGGIATGDLDPSSPLYEESLDMFVDDLLSGQGEGTILTDDVVLGASGRDATITYGFQTMQMLRETFASTSIGFVSVIGTIRDVPMSDIAKLSETDPIRFAQYTDAIDREIAGLGERVARAKAIRVPIELAEVHRMIFQYFRAIQWQYSLAQTIDQDPVRGLVALQALASLAGDTQINLTGGIVDTIASILNR